MERTQPGAGSAERGLITRHGGSAAAPPDAALGRKACIYPSDSSQASAAGLGGKKGLKTHPSFSRQLRQGGGGGGGKKNEGRIQSWGWGWVVPPDEGLSLAQNPEIPQNVVGGRQREVPPGGGWKMPLKFRWDFVSPSPYNSPLHPQITSFPIPKYLPSLSPNNFPPQPLVTHSA